MADGRWQMADGRWQMADGRWQMADGSRSVLTRHSPLATLHSRFTKSQLTDVRETQKGRPGAGQIVVSVWIASLELAVGHLPIISSSIRSRASSSFSGVS